MNKKLLKDCLILIGFIVIFSASLVLIYRKGYRDSVELYDMGYQDGAESVSLSDLCVELRETCVGTDFVEGYGYSIYECKVIRGDWRDDWDIPEEYEVKETDEGVIFKLESK